MYETTKGHQAWRDLVTWLGVQAMRQHGLKLFTGAVQTTFLFRLPRPPSHVKKDGTLRKGKPLLPTSKPDLSKLVRALEDGLSDAKVWTDDCLVTDSITRKRYAGHGLGEPGVDIRVELVTL